MDNELRSDDWCFVCKEGGDTMRICDHEECGKPYHPKCVGKDDSFLEANDHWVCDWHTCSHCHRSSYCHCATCRTSVCLHCLPAVEFIQVKGKYGFCDECLEYASLIERKKDYNSHGEKVDFTDLDTVEGLFKEYYDIIKKENGIEVRDIYAAEESLKIKKEHQLESASEEYNEEQDQISGCDSSENVKKKKRMRKENRSLREKCAPKTPRKSSKIVFIGWASRPLFEFLTSIGKSTNEKLSQDDVASIINEYVKEHKLFHQEKRDRIICDAQLQSLFRRKAVNRRKVYDSLEAHFSENYCVAEQDDHDYESSDSEDEKKNIQFKKPKELDSGNKLEDSVRLSCFASIVVENIKLVYLKKTLVDKLLKQPETFEEKVIGSFVLVKTDPYVCRPRTYYQLVQVEGVNFFSSGENNTQVVLQVSAALKDISIDMLSDLDFSEEECEALRQKMVSGQLKRPTVGDLEQKAKLLHEDLTNYWIQKELSVLEKLIDQAHEKGWRRRFYELGERRKKLETPLEQSKLHANVPRVIPDVNEQLNSNSGDMNSDKGAPQSILQRNSSVPKN